MHSWVFRNRDRLRAIYGHAPAPGQAKPEPKANAEHAGQIIRRQRYVIVFPLPRRRAA